MCMCRKRERLFGLNEGIIRFCHSCLLISSHEPSQTHEPIQLYRTFHTLGTLFRHSHREYNLTVAAVIRKLSGSSANQKVSSAIPGSQVHLPFNPADDPPQKHAEFSVIK